MYENKRYVINIQNFTCVIFFIPIYCTGLFLYKNTYATRRQLIKQMPLNVYKGRKEGNILFNDALNTFYLRLYGVRHMVKDHSDGERGKLLPPHRLRFPISSKGSFICTTPREDSTYHGMLHQSWSTGWNEK